MKKYVVQGLISIVLFFVVFLSYQCYTLSSRVQYLETEIKLSSSHSSTSNANLKLLEYRVSKLNEDKDFFKSIYFDNGSWFIGFVSLLVIIAVGFSIYSNKSDLKNTIERIAQFEDLIKKTTQNLKIELDYIKKTLYNSINQFYIYNAEESLLKNDISETIYYDVLSQYYYILTDINNLNGILDALNNYIKLINNPQTESLTSAKITTAIIKLKDFNDPTINKKVDEVITALDNKIKSQPKTQNKSNTPTEVLP